ncbi:DUF922 domain-containing protein [Aquimarina rhabdastrellae]
MNKLIILLSVILFTNKESYEKFSYSEKSTLEWSDFRGKPKRNSSFAASVNTGVTYHWSYNKEGGVPDFTYDVDSFCYPLLSWVKENEKNEYLLAHEQLHFDISELHARIMRKRLSEYQVEKEKDIKKDLKRMYKIVERLRSEMQEQYDEETDHSKNEEAQKKWEKKVKNLLVYYQKFEKRVRRRR